MDLYVFTESFTKAENLYLNIREKFQSDSLLSLLSSTMASAYSGSKEYKKALQFYKKMLEKDTGDIYIYYQIADIYDQMGKYKKAIKGYQSVIKKDPNYTQAYIQLGKIYFEKVKDYSRAKKYLEGNKRNYELRLLLLRVDVHYYLNMIAVKERRKMDAILNTYLVTEKVIYIYT
jgi:pentatricopeptide repeat protein